MASFSVTNALGLTFKITEIAAHGDLFDAINNKRRIHRRFEEDFIWSVFIQICNGLEHLHSKNILHRVWGVKLGSATL